MGSSSHVRRVSQAGHNIQRLRKERPPTGWARRPLLTQASESRRCPRPHRPGTLREDTGSAECPLTVLTGPPPRSPRPASVSCGLIRARPHPCVWFLPALLLRAAQPLGPPPSFWHFAPTLAGVRCHKKKRERRAGPGPGPWEEHPLVSEAATGRRPSWGLLGGPSPSRHSATVLRALGAQGPTGPGSHE